DARNAGQVAYRVGSGATTNDQAARGIVIASMIISNFGINSGTVAPGQRFFFLNITYRITADKVFGFANDYRITKSIPIYLMWGDDTATVDATETFLGCTSNAHRGLNRAFMNVDIPDLAVDNTDYDGGMYPGFTPAAGGHPPVAPVIGPSNTTDLTPGFIARNDFLVYADTGANANVSGFVQAREFFSLSDESEKVKIQTLPNALELLSKINVYEYNLKGENRKEIGFLAQEMEKLSPLVSSRPDGVKSMSYSGVIALQVEAIKELKKKQDTIKLEMQNLKNELLEIQKSR
ncbi:MAG: tail fiber domain-containing protein, partial [Bdellovibrionales bacterium]